MSASSVTESCGESISIEGVVSAINRLLGTEIKARYSDRRPGDVMHSEADIGLAKELLGYEPLVDFKEGLHRAIEFYRTLV